MSPISLAWGAGRLPYDQAIERERSMRSARRLTDARRAAGDPRPWISKQLFEVIEATPMLMDYWSFAGELQDAARDRDRLEDLDD
jgi:hypothetical protein